MVRTRADKGGKRHTAIGQSFKRVTRSTVLQDKTNAPRADQPSILSPRYEDFYDQPPPNHSTGRSDTTEKYSFPSVLRDQCRLPNGSSAGKPREGNAFPETDQGDPDSAMADMPDCNQSATRTSPVHTTSLRDENFEARPAYPSPCPSPRAPEYQRVSESPDAFDSADSSLRDIQSDEEHSFKNRDGMIKLPSSDYFEEERSQIETDFGEIDLMPTGYMPMGMTLTAKDPDDFPQGMYACDRAGPSRPPPLYGKRKRNHTPLVLDESRRSRYFVQESDSSLGSDTDDHSEYSKKKSKSMISDSDHEMDQVMEQEDEYRPAPPAVAMAQRRLNKSDSECMRDALRMSLMDQPATEWADPFTADNEEMPVDIPIAAQTWDQAADTYYQNTSAHPFLFTGTFCGIGETLEQPAHWPGLQKAVMQEHLLASHRKSTYLSYMEYAIIGNESEKEQEEEEEDTEQEEHTDFARTGRTDSRDEAWEMDSCDLDLIPDCAEDTFRRVKPDESYNDDELKDLYLLLHNHSPLYKKQDDFGRWSPPPTCPEDPAALLQDVLDNLCLIRRLRCGDHVTAERTDNDRGDGLVDALRREIFSTAAQSASSESEARPIDDSRIISDQKAEDTASAAQDLFMEVVVTAE